MSRASTSHPKPSAPGNTSNGSCWRGHRPRPPPHTAPHPFACHLQRRHGIQQGGERHEGVARQVQRYEAGEGGQAARHRPLCGSQHTRRGSKGETVNHPTPTHPTTGSREKPRLSQWALPTAGRAAGRQAGRHALAARCVPGVLRSAQLATTVLQERCPPGPRPPAPALPRGPPRRRRHRSHRAGCTRPPPPPASLHPPACAQKTPGWRGRGRVTATAPLRHPAVRAWARAWAQRRWQSWCPTGWRARQGWSTGTRRPPTWRRVPGSGLPASRWGWQRAVPTSTRGAWGCRWQSATARTAPWGWRCGWRRATVCPWGWGTRWTRAAGPCPRRRPGRQSPRGRERRPPTQTPGGSTSLARRCTGCTPAGAGEHARTHRDAG